MSAIIQYGASGATAVVTLNSNYFAAGDATGKVSVWSIVAIGTAAPGSPQSSYRGNSMALLSLLLLFLKI